MPLSAGARLGAYEIVAPLGAGGMGEVYRATDTKLKRQVAIKILPAALAADADRLARFRREAEVLASLNHPHIAAIYGFEDTNDTHALVMELVEGPTLAEIFREPFGVSPDGTRLAFAAAGTNNVPRLWIHTFDSGQAQVVEGSDNISTGGLFWSPDSRFIAFVVRSELRKVDVALLTVETMLAPLPIGFRGGAWNANGTIVLFVSNIGLLRASPPDGKTTPVVGPAGLRLAFLPDQEHFVYSRVPLAPSDRGVFVGSLKEAPDRQGQTPLLATSASNVSYVPRASSRAGYLLYESSSAVMAQPFDPYSLTTSGEPTRIVSDFGAGSYSASANGVIVYRAGDADSLNSLVWFDRQGVRRGQLGEPARYGNLATSRDGRVVAVIRVEATGGGRTWIVDVTRGVFSRLNPGDAAEGQAAISPDGRVAFSITGQSADIYVKRAGGVESPDLLVKSETVKHPNDWSPDGRYLIYDDHSATQRQDLWVVPLQGNRTSIPFLVTPADETSSTFSTDGKWVAYSSDESGRRDVYVRGFAPDRSPAAAVGQWQVSVNGGDKPRWSPDGKELFYIAADGKMMAVPFKSGALFEPGTPVPLFDTPRMAGFKPYDVAPDGRFLINALPNDVNPFSLRIVMNWFAGIEK